MLWESVRRDSRRRPRSEILASWMWIGAEELQAPSTTRRHRPGCRRESGKAGRASGTSSRRRGCGTATGTRRDEGHLTSDLGLPLNPLVEVWREGLQAGTHAVKLAVLGVGAFFTNFTKPPSFSPSPDLMRLVV